MRRLYTTIISLSIFGWAGAQISTSTKLMNGAIYGGPQKLEKNAGKVFLDQALNSGNVAKPKKNQVTNRAADHSSFVTIGETYYDLQSNYAMPHRLVKVPGTQGSMVATWTTSPSGAAGFPGRGAGYNYRNDQGDWMTPSADKVEPTQRSGWPNIAVLSDGSVITLGHDASNGGFYRTHSPNVSERPSTTTYVLAENPYKPIWSRMDNNGDTVHLICSYTDSAAPGESRAPTRNGIFAPMVYSRSVDGGETWEVSHQMLPNYDSSITNNGGADQYSIDVRGNTVAIANADLMQGVIVWKSEDAGNSWKRYLADSFPYAPFTGKKFMTDTPYTADGTVDVIIDANGKVHAFWGLARVFDDDTTDESYSFFPGVQGLVYWNEDLEVGKLVASGGAFDRGSVDGPQDGFNQLEQPTYSGVQNGTLPTGLATVCRLGNTSALRQPSAAIDPNGNIYCTFSIPIEFDLSDLNGNFRDIGVVHSTDGGETWAESQNLTQFMNKEDDFACVAREADEFLHVMWQQDDAPGTNLQNNVALYANHEVFLNTIYYQAVPVSQILNGEIGHLHYLSVDKPNTGEVFVVDQNYPNPFDQKSNVLVYLTRPGNVQIEVRDIMGALVQNYNFDQLQKGNHLLELNANGLKAGAYHYTVIAGNNSVTKTMVVK